MKTLSIPFLRRSFCALVAAALLAPVVQALVDDAHSLALELAAGPVQKGFRVRQDYWNGELKAGETREIRAQMFKGNEYWVWFGADVDGGTLTLEILDKAGQPVAAAETAKSSTATGVRIVPPRTGSYRLVFKATGTKPDPYRWAVVLGYK